MKVDVIQADDVKFGRFSWWSNWVDIAVVDYDYKSYLLQMKVSRSNSKSFKLISMNPKIFWTLGVSCNEIGDLTQMKGNKNGN